MTVGLLNTDGLSLITGEIPAWVWVVSPVGCLKRKPTSLGRKFLSAAGRQDQVIELRGGVVWEGAGSGECKFPSRPVTCSR